MTSFFQRSMTLLSMCIFVCGCSDRYHIPKENPPALKAKATIVLEYNTRDVLMKKHSDIRLPVASLVKLMTAILTERECALDSGVSISTKEAGLTGNLALLRSGEKLTIRDLLGLMLVASNNSAATALAEHLGQRWMPKESRKTYPAKTAESIFVAEMNRHAIDIGMKNTHFANPHGLDCTNAYSSARDIARLFIKASERPVLLGLMGKQKFSCHSIDGKYHHVVKNTNELLGVNPGVTAGKTGTTKQAKETLAFLWKNAQNDLYVIVILGSTDRYADAHELIDWLTLKETYHETRTD